MSDVDEFDLNFVKVFETLVSEKGDNCSGVV